MYSIHEVCERTGLSAHTLRYYEKEKLLPNVGRSPGGFRQYSEEDVETLGMICCLKNTGMSLQDISRFMTLAREGDQTLRERCELLKKHRDTVIKRMEEMQRYLDKVTLNSALYYTKDAADLHADFIDAVFAAQTPESGADQRDQFYGVLADTLEDGITFDVVQSLHERLTAQLADRKPSAGPLQVSRGKIANLLSVSTKEKDAFQEEYLEQFGAVGMEATTVVEPKKFVIETENATIQVDSSRSDLVEMKRIDGRRYILVAVEGEATVNGVEVNIP